MPKDVWKIRRKQLNEGFKYPKLKHMIPNILRPIGQLSSILENSKGEKIEISNLLTKMTTEIIGIVGFGLEFNSLQQKSGGLYPYINRIMEESTNMLTYIPYFHKLPTPHNRLLWKSITEVTSATMHVVEKRIAMLNDPENQEQIPHDILQVLLDPENKLSPKAILSNAIGFLIAGSETTSIALSWISR